MKSKASLRQEIKDIRLRLKEGKVPVPTHNLYNSTFDGLMEHKTQLRELLAEHGLATQSDVPGSNVEEFRTEAAVDGILADPFLSFEAAAKESGLNPSVYKSLMKRLKAKHNVAIDRAKEMSTAQLLVQINQKIAMVLDHIDPFVLADASFKDLAIGLGILTEKRQLLSGEPTQILSMTERQEMKDILPEFIREVTRRGITIDQNDGTRLIPAPPSDKAVSATARRHPPKPVEDNLNG